jgi:regulatory protein
MRKSKRPLSPHEALSRAMKLCSREEKCSFDIRQKLYQWGVTDQSHDDIINQLIDDKFLSDERFVRYFVRDKFRFNKWGKIKIEYLLKQKKIPGALISQAICEEIPDENYNSTLKELLEAKYAQTNETDPIKLKAKLVRYAASRGFESGKVFEVVNKMID